MPASYSRGTKRAGCPWSPTNFPKEAVPDWRARSALQTLLDKASCSAETRLILLRHNPSAKMMYAESLIYLD